MNAGYRPKRSWASLIWTAQRSGMLIENGGVIIRIPASSINIYKRDVQGVIVMRIEEGNQVVSLERVENIEEEAAE